MVVTPYDCIYKFRELVYLLLQSINIDHNACHKILIQTRMTSIFVKVNVIDNLCQPKSNVLCNDAHKYYALLIHNVRQSFKKDRQWCVKFISHVIS